VNGTGRKWNLKSLSLLQVVPIDTESKYTTLRTAGKLLNPSQQISKKESNFSHFSSEMGESCAIQSISKKKHFQLTQTLVVYKTKNR
jgi:hypothetical protein